MSLSGLLLLKCNYSAAKEIIQKTTEITEITEKHGDDYPKIHTAAKPQPKKA